MKTQLNILIADDDQDDASMLQESLTEVLSTCSVTNASDGIECLRLIKNGFQPDVVFMDLNMPLKNGLECLRDIQNKHVEVSTPIIVYSTSQNLKDINAASLLGASFYMVKPTSYNALTQLLRQIFHLLQQPEGQPLSKNNFLISQQKFAA